jgi:hypothetical protein
VRTTLTAEGVVVYVKKDKENFTKRDLGRVLDAIWNTDGLASIPERYRVYSTLIILFYCETGARLSAFFKGSLRYEVSCWNWLLSENVCRRQKGH